jgi:hypothetical protein
VIGAGSAAGVVALPVAARPDAAVEVLLPALHRGAVALVLAMAVVAGLSAGDARAIVGADAPDLPVAASAPAPGTPVAASTPAPAGRGGERLLPGRRYRV